MREDELRTLPDATLIHMAKNVKHYEARESRDELVLELARRLEQWNTSILSSPEGHENFLLKDGWE
jgi:hypothetical protein